MMKRSNKNKKSVKEVLNCTICFDECSREGGSCCARNHFVCESCFAPYVNSFCDDIGKFKDSKYEIACPVIRCNSSHRDTSKIRQHLDDASIDKYVETLKKVCKNELKRGSALNSRSLEEFARCEVLDCLCIKCPGCKEILDPEPDGCCAMRCVHCGVYFCWLCFAMQADSLENHRHVLACPKSLQPGHYFVAKKYVDQVHKELRIGLVKHILMKYWLDLNPFKLDSCHNEWKSCPRVLAMVESCKADLFSLNIAVNDFGLGITTATSSSSGSSSLLTSNSGSRTCLSDRIRSVVTKCTRVVHTTVSSKLFRVVGTLSLFAVVLFALVWMIVFVVLLCFGRK